jgi:DNA invertase Pin-like site-specific DNA recombinase
MPDQQLKPKKNNPNTALCYVRLSYTRDGRDTESPERQRANIKRVCEQYGWKTEFYEDTSGHKSATKETNRPGWLALKARLGDDDVVALVANDLSRLHRKGWRIGDLLDFVDENDVRLVLAAQDKQVDFSTPLGRLMIQIGALFDEWYAQDIGQRSKDSIRFRKSEGKTIGIPPFGTKRNEDGFLVPTEAGTWLLADGAFVRGKVDQAPSKQAIWRGFHAAAHRVLELYATGTIGIDKIAQKMNSEGWTYRNRSGEPIPFAADSIRRIVANWPEYGGYISVLRAKERHPLKFPFESYRLNPERSIFSVDLLYRVGKVRYQRIRQKTIDDGLRRSTYPYPLLGLVYCHHCEKLAIAKNDSSHRSRLGGKNKTDDARYRHKPSVYCDCSKRSIKRETLEAQVGDLISGLSIDSVQLDAVLSKVRAQNLLNAVSVNKFEAEKRVGIAKSRRRLAAARKLYADGEITRGNYLSRKEKSLAEISAWESGTPDHPMSLASKLKREEGSGLIARLWQEGSDVEKQMIARNLFERIVVNLDTQSIAAYTLSFAP